METDTPTIHSTYSWNASNDGKQLVHRILHYVFPELLVLFQFFFSPHSGLSGSWELLGFPQKINAVSLFNFLSLYLKRKPDGTYLTASLINNLSMIDSFHRQEVVHTGSL
ncbi:hypothetical protein TNCV_1697961 [Trichonephila clavipes]|nr:hypothetical protein TNCV_1697961 [Trichonephila clavipes]